MQKRILGKNFEVGAVGLGCMGFTHAYGAPMEDNEAIKIIHAAVDMGYTLFDTAERYTGFLADGTKTWNETLVGKALAPYRSKIKIATKFGITITEKGERIYDSRPETIRKSLEGSLKRLNTDYIDLYYQHRIDPITPAEEVASVIADLIKEGKILQWGISNTDEEHLRKAHAVCPVTCIQNRSSIMARWEEALFPVLEELNIGFVAYSPLANGILSDVYENQSFTNPDDFRSFMPQYQEEGHKQNASFLNLIRKLADKKRTTPAQISLAWILNKKPYIVPIPGSRKIERLQENANALTISFSQEEMQEIENSINELKAVVFSGLPKSLEKRWDS